MAIIENETFNPALSSILQRCGLSPENFPDTGITPEDKVRFSVCAQQLAWWLAMQREPQHGSKHGGLGQFVTPLASHGGSGSCLINRLSWKRVFGASGLHGADNCRQ